jgi:hypothetical protein
MMMIESRNLAWDPIQWSDEVKIHAIMMLLGWGFFIPVAMFTNSLLYRRTFRLHHFGVNFHIVFVTIGMVFALTGLGYAFRHFTVFTRDNVSKYRMAHGVIGSIASFGVVLQALLMIIMRPPKYEGQSYTTWPLWQKFGHFGHRGLGFLWFVFALVALETGTHITSVSHIEELANRNEYYSAGFIGAILATVLTVASTVLFVLFLFPAQVTHNEPDVEVQKGDTEKEQAPEHVLEA